MTSKIEEARIISRFENRMPVDNHPGRAITNWKYFRDGGQVAEIHDGADLYEGSEVLVHVTAEMFIGTDGASFGSAVKVAADVACSIIEHPSVCCWTVDPDLSKIKRASIHLFGVPHEINAIDLADMPEEIKKEIMSAAEGAIESAVD